MSVRRINFLKRKKILGKDVQIQLSVVGHTKRFHATANFGDYAFPPEGKIFVDVTQSSMETIRFDCGTVAKPNFREEDISRLTGESIVFNLYVIDLKTSQKLGAAQAIRIKSKSGEMGGSNSLLPVDGTKDLDGVIWRVDFDAPGAEGATDAPVLRVDKTASRGSAADFLSNPSNAAMILPAAMRTVLGRILLNDGDYEYDASSPAWRDAWVRFATNQHADSLPEEGALDDLSAWIEKSCAAFARRSGLRDGFLKQLDQ
jgi:hypothetical protein